jgi:hypothetical protein
LFDIVVYAGGFGGPNRAGTKQSCACKCTTDGTWTDGGKYADGCAHNHDARHDEHGITHNRKHGVAHNCAIA